MSIHNPGTYPVTRVPGCKVHVEDTGRMVLEWPSGHQKVARDIIDKPTYDAMKLNWELAGKWKKS